MRTNTAALWAAVLFGFGLSLEVSSVRAAVSGGDGFKLKVEAVKGGEFERGLVRRISENIRKAKGLYLSSSDPDYILKVSARTLPPSKTGQATSHYMVSVTFLANFKEEYKAKLIAAVEDEYKKKTKKFLDSDLVLFSDQILHEGKLANLDADCAALAKVFIRALAPAPAAAPVRHAPYARKGRP